MRIKDVLLITLFALMSFVTLTGCTQKKMLWNGKDFTGWELRLPGSDKESARVWSVREGVIHCDGVPNGYMRTTKEYSNYKLHLEWRWVQGDYRNRNSGVLVRVSGPDRLWPKCIEAQLHSGDAGDFWLIGGTAITVDRTRTESSRRPMRVKKMKQSSEKPIGQWNKYDIFCEGDTIRCYVNDALQNSGTDASVTKGNIALQSEGAPIQFRDIYIEPLE